MADQVRYRRGTAALHALFTGAGGELTVDVDNNRVVVHDGAKPGGWPAARYDEAIIKPAGGLTVGDLLYASSGTALARLADVATGNVLLSGGVATAPVWGKISLRMHVGDVLAVENGGTGAGDSDTARANLAAAKLGANTDINSLKAGVTIPTPATGDASTKIANCAFVGTAVANGIASLTAGSPAELDTFLESYNRFLAEESALSSLNTQVAARLVTANNLSEIAAAGAAAQKAARANLGLDRLTTVGDANYAIQPADRTIVLTAPLTAARTWTLPAASGLNPGAALRVADQAGGVSAANTLTIAAAGPDTINGAAAASFAAPYTDFQLVTDGAGKWTFDVQGVARGGTGATTAVSARANLGAAASGDNPDITALLGLTGKVAFTPVATFGQPGDLSVSYATQVGTIYKVGKLTFVYVSLVFTPTYTTATGTFKITGLPIAGDSGVQSALTVEQFSGATAITWPGSATYLYGRVAGSSDINVYGTKAGTTTFPATQSQFASGNQITLTLSGLVLAA